MTGIVQDVRGVRSVTGPDPAVAATRLAVRSCLMELPDDALALVACSGGADSLALAAAVAFEAPRLGRRAGALVVDHNLQPGSAVIAGQAARRCTELGLDPVDILLVRVVPGNGGPEAAARSARLEALEAAAARLGSTAVLLGHTRDDQAEQVLLGLARGSGARSLSGMPRWRGIFHRPLLGVSRDVTHSACEAQGLDAWNDPHNDDPSYRRVRARQLLRSLEGELGPGFGAALARSADLLREDADYLDEVSAQARAGVGMISEISVAAMEALPRPLRTRVWRLLAVEAGSPVGSVTAAHVESLDALITAWHGQGPLHVPGPVRVKRSGGHIALEAVPRPLV